ncbi:TlyA family RNA methyltransferase [Peredibacter sp. HCB2-198]|uniref:TlyA family RNA methyltransferase n=1 Tax=Peredibacter sp. HCB2-198 TaxID=3383025 RepID=UPI0038B4DF16
MKERADKVLADKGLASTRSQAKSLIENGDVTINGIVIKKAGEMIDPESKIEITTSLYVGRGAFKLEKALEEFKIEIKDKVFLDLGASTGGFTEVLLLNDAKKVYAIDVGHDQLAPKLREDSRVINMEGTNIREITSLPEMADGGVMDLSFISITKVLDVIKTLLNPGSPLIVLVKPQFEAGKERMPKDNVIKDPKLQQQVLKEVLDFATAHGWQHLKTIDSPIEGKSGNKEFLSWLVRV